MARPRTATNILQLKGAFKKDPQRKADREREPVPKAGIGPAPKWFKAKEREAWDYLVGIVPHGVLGDSDRAHLEVAARLLAFSRTVAIELVSDGKLARLDSMLGKMGLNPAERSKVKAEQGKPQNPFEAL